jgi:hypothetical protein
LMLQDFRSLIDLLLRRTLVRSVILLYLMKKSSLFIIVIVIVALLLGTWKAYDGIYFKKNNHSMTIKCHYMAYACGDCYPLWYIDSRFAVENNFKNLIEKDLYVIYKGKEVEESLPDSVNKCIICYDFYFTGLMKKTLSDKHKFEVDSFQMRLKFSNCCN